MERCSTWMEKWYNMDGSHEEGEIVNSLFDGHNMKNKFEGQGKTSISVNLRIEACTEKYQI